MNVKLSIDKTYLNIVLCVNNYRDCMSNKQKLYELITKYQAIEHEMKDLKHQLTNIVATLPDEFLEDDVELMVKLKYEDVNYSDPGEWLKIKTLPESVLVRWERRLWLEWKSIGQGTTKQDILKAKLGEKNFKYLSYWLWCIPDFIKSVICDPGSEITNWARAAHEYDRGNSLLKTHIVGLFDMLNEEILIYENKLKK